MQMTSKLKIDIFVSKKLSTMKNEIVDSLKSVFPQEKK
jgi:hypothetical protein